MVIVAQLIASNRIFADSIHTFKVLPTLKDNKPITKMVVTHFSIAEGSGFIIDFMKQTESSVQSVFLSGWNKF